jgi:hypothetical protein
MLNHKTVIERAGQIYARRKRSKGLDVPVEIISDQVKSLCEALVDDINTELQKMEIKRMTIKR